MNGSQVEALNTDSSGGEPIFPKLFGLAIPNRFWPPLNYCRRGQKFAPPVKKIEKALRTLD